MKQIYYRFLTPELRLAHVPDHWPMDAVAEVLAFRAKANPGDIFELVLRSDGVYELVATGTSV